MEATTVGHALTELWIVNTGSTSEVSVVVVYATGGWTVLERVRLSCTPSGNQTLGFTSVECGAWGSRGECVAMLEQVG